MKQEEVFILRRWRSRPKELWRASLKNIETKEVQYFHSPESLAKYFAQITEQNHISVKKEHSLSSNDSYTD